MKSLRIVDGQATYVIILDVDHDAYLQRDSLTIHSVWRFYPGRPEGEHVSSTNLPWHARQRIAEILGDSIP